jgi:hypothetical protein
VLTGFAWADTIKPARDDILGCKGVSSLVASVQTDAAGNMLPGQPQDAQMAAALIKSGECFRLGKATIKDMGEYRFERVRVMAILPNGEARKLWVIYGQLYGKEMTDNMDLTVRVMELGDCKNDCRD